MKRGATLRIGLTGPIGCGKSTVAAWLADLGADVIDADEVAREVVAPGEPGLAAVVAAFGPGVLSPDDTLDRAALAAIVFADAAARRRLEAIIRPAVRPRILERLSSAEARGASIVVLEAIGLVEGGYAPLCDEVWLVQCRPDEQLDRLLKRGADPDDAKRRIAAQAATIPAMEAAATRIIDTGGSMTVARRRVEAALAGARALRGPRPGEAEG